MKKHKTEQKQVAKIPEISKENLGNQKQAKWMQWFIFAFTILLYANTLGHKFTQDDAIVIYNNDYTKAGIWGFKDIFTKDTFAGFFKDDSKLNLVSGGRYRPFTLAMFAMEYQIVGNNPLLGHLINVLLFAFLCLMLFKLLNLLFNNVSGESKVSYLSLIISLIYAAHPIHTEAVANIKGRDEIMAMLGSALSLYYFVKYFDNKQINYLFFSMIALFIGLLSKENTITFLAIIPISLFFFRNISFKESVQKSLFLIGPVVLFLLIRSAVVGNNFGNQQPELMNNPFLKMENGLYIPFDFAEKMATIFYTLGKYLQLLFFPHPLTHDYYPRHIAIMHFSDYGVILSLISYLIIGYFGFKGLKNKTLVSFGILYFFITTSIVSNFVFPIGTNMSERFMFMPSLGFAVVFGFLLHEYIFLKYNKGVFWGVFGLVIILFSLKTVTRNLVWESDHRLFMTDVKTSSNSAKILNAAAGTISNEYLKEQDSEKQKEMLGEALIYINKAIEIHPTYKNAYLIKGNILSYQVDYPNSIKAYEKALELDASFNDAKNNYAITLRLAGKQAGEKENNLQKAEMLLTKSDSLKPNDFETLRLLGVINGIKGNHTKAVSYFEKSLLYDSQNASTNFNIGMAYKSIGNNELGAKYLQKAAELDPQFKQK